MDSPNQSPTLYIVRKPVILPAVVTMRAIVKSIVPNPTIYPPKTTSTSLGDGGIIFSMYEMAKSRQ
jgi:hypothetical protein